MVEQVQQYTEEDLAREMEESKRENDVSQTGDEQGGAAGNGPKRRAPPRRKTGSKVLGGFENTPVNEGEGV